MRGGANGARIQLAPQNQWAINEPESLASTLETLKQIQSDFNGDLSRGKKVSLADVIVIAGNAAIEKAAKQAGFDIKVPVKLGRMDATQQQTDVKSFAVLEPQADAFRNYYTDSAFYDPAKAMVDKANLLNLTVPELTVLIGGMRVLDANANGVKHGVLTNTPGTLNNHFFVNLLDMSTQWSKSGQDGIYKGIDRTSGKQKWTATTVDLLFGANTELRAVAEAYAANDGKKQFVEDFASAWNKVMNADRFNQ